MWAPFYFLCWCARRSRLGQVPEGVTSFAWVDLPVCHQVRWHGFGQQVRVTLLLLTLPCTLDDASGTVSVSHQAFSPHLVDGNKNPIGQITVRTLSGAPARGRAHPRSAALPALPLAGEVGAHDVQTQA